jgi:hypothetical protein
MDENFPDPLVIEIANRFTPELDLRPIRIIEPRLTGGIGDDRVILGLHQLRIEGLVTNDANMLFLPEVLSIIDQTGFTVVACESSGHDALVATGLLLTHLSRVARRHRPKTPQVWLLRAPDRGPERFEALRASAEARTGLKVADFRLTRRQLQEPVA